MGKLYLTSLARGNRQRWAKYCANKELLASLTFNFFVAFYYEATLEIFISIFCAMGHLLSPTDYFETWSAVIGWFFIVTEAVFLVWFVAFMFFPCPRPHLRMEEYIDNVGSVYENIYYSNWANRLIPLLFVLKRAFMPFCIFLVKTELVAIYLVVIMVNLCLILHLRPYIDPSIHKIELFNEAIGLVFFLSLQRYRFIEADPELITDYAWYSISILALYMTTHISSNLFATIKATIESCKRKNKRELEYANSMEK